MLRTIRANRSRVRTRSEHRGDDAPVTVCRACCHGVGQSCRTAGRRNERAQLLLYAVVASDAIADMPGTKWRHRVYVVLPISSYDYSKFTTTITVPLRKLKIN